MKQRNLKKIISGISALCVVSTMMPACNYSKASEGDSSIIYGDIDGSGKVEISDAAKIMSYVANTDKYSLSESQKNLADVYQRGDGISNMDALAVEKYIAQIINELPESVNEQVSDVTYIHLKGTEIQTEGNNVSVDGTKVTISSSGTYYVDGTLDDGQIYINIPDEIADPDTVKIFLNGVNITGLNAPAIFIENAANTSVNLVSGTKNVISDGTAAYDGDYLDNGVVNAKDDITFKGDGELEITANTQYAVSCNNDIKFNGAKVNITTLIGDAVRGKKSVTVKSGTLNIDSKGDGIKSTKGNVAIEGGSVSVKAGNDAIQAETTIDISAGTVTAGGDRGLTAITGVNILGGTVVATATDNQTDASLITASQDVLLLNCIDCPDSTDGTWKKSNSIQLANSSELGKFTKKYKYVLVSTGSVGNSSYTLTNSETGAVITHSIDESETFEMTNTVMSFDNVNPAGKSETVVSGYTINLKSNEILTNAPAETASVSNGVITITQPGIFSVSGEMTEGQIVVNVDKTAYPTGMVELDLKGVNLSNTSDSPIYIASIGDECQIVAKSGYENVISDGTSYTNADGKMGAIYSCDDLKIKGSGNLTVNGNCEDAIVSKNDLKIYNGNIIVNAVDDAIRGKDSVTIGNAADTDFSTLSVTVKSSSGDGIKSTETDTASGKGFIKMNGGTVNITAYSDGFHASQLLEVNGGNVTIETTCPATSSGGNSGGWGRPGGNESSSTSTEVSAKGLKAGCTDDTTNAAIEGTINISDGTININSTDDSVHATNINILGGDLTASSGDDGVHADDVLIVNGGSTNIIKSYEGLEASDIQIKDGTIHVVASDDGFNAAGGNDSSGNINQGGWGGGFSSSTGTLKISGGYMFVRADGDGIDSNGDISIIGGTVLVCGPTSGGNGIFDKGDGNYSFTISGGTVLGIGSSDMMETPSASNGKYLVASNGVSLKAGNLISASDENGNVIAVLTVPSDMNMNGAIQFYSDKANDSTVLYTGGTYSGTLNSDGYGESGTISGASKVTSGSGNSGFNPWG